MGRLGSNAVRSSTGRVRGRRSRVLATTTVAGGSYVRRRSRVPRSVTIVFSILVLGLVWVGTAASTQTDPVVVGDPSNGSFRSTTALTAVQADARAAPAEAEAPEAIPIVARDEAPPVFATVRDLELHLPYDDPVAVAFHEASRAEALALRPQGRLLANDNPSKFDPPAMGAGPGYRVLASRGRGGEATSAVDVVVPRGAVVNAPVSGRVIEVRRYPLYDRLMDWRIVIAPESATGLEVVLIHLDDPRVRVGQRVVAGETPLATVRLLAFDSQIDYVTERHLPHTHLEVKAAAQALDPSAPAVPAAAGDR